VERAVHRLEVVVLPLAPDVALLVLLLVQVHGGVHALGVPVEVPGDLEELALGDVGAVDELVALLDVAAPGVLLHLHADDPTPGVEDREARADLVREGEQVELVPEPAVVAPLRLGEPGGVRDQVVLRGPGGAVDPLELGVLLAPPPVGRRRAHQGETVADDLGRGHVRAAAQVLPRGLAVAAHVVVDGELAGPDLHGGALGLLRTRRALDADQFQLVGLVGELGAGLLLGDHAAPEGLPLLDDAGHGLLQRPEVLRREGLGHVEVVVEAVRDRRADPQLGVGVHLLHRLGEHVRGGVAHDGQPVRRADGDGFDDVVGPDLHEQVPQFTAHPHGDDIAPAGEERRAGGPLGDGGGLVLGRAGHGVLLGKLGSCQGYSRPTAPDKAARYPGEPHGVRVTSHS